VSAAQSSIGVARLSGANVRWVEVVSHLDPKYGGLSAAVPSLGERLGRETGLDVQLAAFCAQGEEFRPDGFDDEQLSYWPVGRAEWMKDHTLRERFEAMLRGADGVHIHGLWEQSTAIAAKTARKLGVPYVLSAHGMLEPWALANKRLKKMVYAALIERNNVQRAACLHALTKAEAEQYVRFGATSPIAVIPNGVDIPKIKDATLFLKKYPRAGGRRLVLFMARLHPKKGIDMLLEAWNAVTNQHQDALLVVAGPDADGMRARLEQFCSEHFISDRVLFTGMLQGAMKWSALAASECFVLPSFSEGLSVGVLEAMGMGLPVLITKPCNMPEVEEYRTGWQIKANEEALATALEEMLGNPPSKNALIGRLGARLVATRYAWSTVATQMQDVYSWIQGGPMPPSVDVMFP
jgi:glycosyltransferase involved in cell wall biosynthesis